MMKKLAPFLVLLAGILWGMIGIFVRKLNSAGLDSMGIVMIRAISTTFLLFLFLLFYNRNLLKIKFKDVWCFIGTGILSIVFFNFCYFKAITLTSLSIAAVLLYTAPAIVMIFSAILFRERFTAVKIISLIATFLGCVLVTGIVGAQEKMSLPGLIVGLGAGLGYALYSIFSRFALERGYHSLTISFYTFVFAMFGTIPFVKGKELWHICMNDSDLLLFCMIFGLVSTVIPYIVYTLGLKEMENGRASIIASVEPVAATLLGVVAFHEKILFHEFIGMVLVLGAIIICNIVPDTDSKE